eukprot:12415390-Karenia_brevis.AAC.1
MIIIIIAIISSIIIITTAPRTCSNKSQQQLRQQRQQLQQQQQRQQQQQQQQKQSWQSDILHWCDVYASYVLLGHRLLHVQIATGRSAQQKYVRIQVTSSTSTSVPAHY